MLAVVITLMLVDELPEDKEKQAAHRSSKFICKTFANVFSQMRKPEQLLLIPLCIFVGMELSLYEAEFTKVNNIKQ